MFSQTNIINHNDPAQAWEFIKRGYAPSNKSPLSQASANYQFAAYVKDINRTIESWIPECQEPNDQIQLPDQLHQSTCDIIGVLEPESPVAKDESEFMINHNTIQQFEEKLISSQIDR